MTNDETILKYVSDMAGAEHHLAHTLKAQEADSDLQRFPKAVLMIGRIRSTAEQHLAGLESLAKTLGGEARSDFKETVTAMTGGALGAISHLRSHNVSKMLRDDYISLSMNAVGYSMLHTTGLSFNAARTAEVALAYLKDTAQLIMELSQESIPVVVDELKETNTVVDDAAGMAQKNVRNAWTS